MTTLCQEVPKHRDYNVCSRFTTGTGCRACPLTTPCRNCRSTGIITCAVGSPPVQLDITSPTFFHSPISVHSTRIPVVCSSAQEAEYGGTFAVAKIADLERQVLSDFGYPQPPTTIHCDNEVAVGLANRTIKPKMSKSCDMRFHWLQDRVRRRQFRVQHIRGIWNVADFFTKSLPVSRHKVLVPFIALDPSTTYGSSQSAISARLI
jgi:hypothetical protein